MSHPSFCHVYISKFDDRNAWRLEFPKIFNLLKKYKSVLVSAECKLTNLIIRNECFDEVLEKPVFDFKSEFFGQKEARSE